ncbi:MAG: hypothetical protein KAH31_02260 [Candidatus Sabulitectum sp.]|nr:hypothetical protein [Candidatus Sabulitectum sp.]
MYRLILVTVFTALVFSSCSLFEPRVPEDPSNAGVVWLSPTSPDIVVENMQSALNGRSALYLDCLTESFIFYADTNDIYDYPSYNFSDWTKTVENSTVTALYSQVPVDSTVASGFTMDISHPDPAAPTDSVTIYRKYNLTFPQTYHSGTGSPAVGIAEFHMVEDSIGLWAVQEWRDVRHEEETSWVTWAVAKAYYR